MPQEAENPGLTPDAPSIVRYLESLGLTAGAPVVSVEEMQSTRLACLVQVADGHSFFIKQYSHSPTGEIQVYRALENGVLPGDLERLLPRCLSLDPVARIAVYEGFPAHHTWQNLLAAEEGFRPDLAADVGSLMATLHKIRLAGDAAVRFGEAGIDSASIPIRTWDDITVEQFAHSPGFDFRQYLEIAQGVSQQLHRLREGWTRERIVHGDFKADNVLVSGQEEGRTVRLVDWEMTRLGDPLFDLGTAVGCVVLSWLNLVRASRSGDLAGWFGTARVKSSTLVRCLRVLTDSYFARSNVQDGEAARRRTWLFAGYFLLERGVVANWTAGRFTLSDKLAIELGARILESPDRTYDVFYPQECPSP